MISMIASTASRYRQLIFALSFVVVASAGCSKEDPPKISSCLARRRLLPQGNITSRKDYRDALRLAPEDPAALRQLGILYLEQGKFDRPSLLKRSAEL